MAVAAGAIVERSVSTPRAIRLTGIGTLEAIAEVTCEITGEEVSVAATTAEIAGTVEKIEITGTTIGTRLATSDGGTTEIGTETEIGIAIERNGTGQTGAIGWTETVSIGIIITIIMVIAINKENTVGQASHLAEVGPIRGDSSEQLEIR